MAGLGKENPGNLLRLHFNCNRVIPGTIKHGRNLAGGPYAARGILVELALTGLSYDYFRHCGLSFPCIGHG
jgi:hypothetical protein